LEVDKNPYLWHSRGIKLFNNNRFLKGEDIVKALVRVSIMEARSYRCEVCHQVKEAQVLTFQPRTVPVPMESEEHYQLICLSCLHPKAKEHDWKPQAVYAVTITCPVCREDLWGPCMAVHLHCFDPVWEEFEFKEMETALCAVCHQPIGSEEPSPPPVSAFDVVKKFVETPVHTCDGKWYHLRCYPQPN
jgi:hypothetical protein